MMGMALHFQDASFLANYAAMQHNPGSLKPVTSPDEAAKERPASKGGTQTRAEQPVGSAVEIGGRNGPEPTRFGDWEKAGRCIDF